MPLHEAVEKGYTNTIQKHIAAKTNLNKKDAAGLTPLHVAAMKGDAGIVQILIAAGADPKQTTPEGKTALELAQEKGHAEIMQLLQTPSGGKGGRGLIDGGLGVSEAMDGL